MAAMKNDCIFCAIAAGEIPAFKIYEDAAVVAFLDINPFSRGHALVVPKEHCATLFDAPEELLASMLPRVRKVAARLKEALPCDGVNILQNNGAAAGQSVGHLHFHIVPRMAPPEGEAARISFAPGKADMEELKALAQRLSFQ